MRLVARDLSCIRAGREVLRDIRFSVRGGECLALRGPNGAGKTTLLRLVAGLLRPAGGTVELDGGDEERSIGEQAHFVGHLDAVKPALSAAENLGFWAAMLGGGEATEVHRALERVGLGPLAAFPAAVLSAGQRRRLALARLLAASRSIWLLDEPLNALDADGRERLAALIGDHLATGGIVLAATHVDLPHVSATLELGRRR